MAGRYFLEIIRDCFVEKNCRYEWGRQESLDKGVVFDAAIGEEKQIQ